MQYRRFRSELQEQAVVKKKEKMKLRAHIAVEDGNDVEAVVGQVMDQGTTVSSPTIWPIMSANPKRKILRLTPS